MKREIKFRGKDKWNRWHFGNLYICSLNDGVSVRGHYVFPDSVGQHVGLKDNDGRDIYEGDIIKTPSGVGVIRFCDGAFVLANDYEGATNYEYLSRARTESEFSVIGNVYDNPELL